MHSCILTTCRFSVVLWKSTLGGSMRNFHIGLFALVVALAGSIGAASAQIQTTELKMTAKHRPGKGGCTGGVLGGTICGYHANEDIYLTPDQLRTIKQWHLENKQQFEMNKNLGR